MQNAMRGTLIELTESNNELWQQMYCMFFGSLLPWPGGEGAEHLWSKFLFGRVDRSQDAARYDLTTSQVKTASKVFAGQWSARASITDFRVLAVLKEPTDPDLWSSLEDCGINLCADSQPRAEAAFQLAELSDEQVEEMRASEPPHDPMSGRPSHMATVYRMRHWGWAHMWHTQMSRDRHGYSSPDARVQAVLALDSAEDSLDSVEQAVWRAKPFRHVGADIVDESPTAWSKADERCDVCHAYGEGRAKLMTCSGCKVTKYCSKACQRAGWKAGHKQMCVMLKSIATSGTTCTLT